MDLILASTSPYRRIQVERLGLPFRCVAPLVDEDALKQAWGSADPASLAGRLAETKARSVAEVEPAATVIGGDQLVAFDGQILGKPGTAEAATAQLSAMSGRPHQLITALAVIHDGRLYAETNVTTLALRSLTLDEIRRYVEAERPIDCAGSYKIEGRGIALFEAITSSDQTAIIGVPMIALTTILRGLGYPIP